MEEINHRLDILEQKMDKILELLERDCKKMSDHIDFVEHIYDSVKTPFYYLMNRIKTVKTISF
jgi:hypothetical protein